MNKKIQKKPASGLLVHRKVRRSSGRISRRQLFIVIGAFILVMAGIFSTFYYQNYVAPFNRMIISIDNTKITMRYFLDKARITGSDPMSLLQTVTQEEIIKLMAPTYGIEVNNTDVDKYLRSLAAGGEESLSDIEFREWYRQKLNDNNMTDAQFKEIIHNQLLSNRLQEYLQERVPTILPQVHLYWIVTTTLDDAQKAETRLNAGESFTAVAKDVSIDTSTRDNGGELGWFPPAVSTYKDQIEKLDVNQNTGPIAHYPASDTTSATSTSSQTPDSFFIFMVSEKDPARQVDDSSLSILKSEALDTWFNNEIKNHNVKYNFNSEIYAWLTYQLQKNNTSGTTTSSGSSSGG